MTSPLTDADTLERVRLHVAGRLETLRCWLSGWEHGITPPVPQTECDGNIRALRTAIAELESLARMLGMED